MQTFCVFDGAVVSLLSQPPVLSLCVGSVGRDPVSGWCYSVKGGEVTRLVYVMAVTKEACLGVVSIVDE